MRNIMWALAGIVFIILILKLGQTAGSKSLWVDEFATSVMHIDQLVCGVGSIS